MFAEDTSIFLADFGVPASMVDQGSWSLDQLTPTLDTLGGATLDGWFSGTLEALVLFDEPDREILGNRAISADYTILYRTQDFPGLDADDQITVNSQLFTVAHAMKIEDGVFSRALLQL